MKVVKIKTETTWDGLTPGKVYDAIPRKDTLAPYINPYIYFGSNISQKLDDQGQYYLIALPDKGTKKYYYPVSEFEPVEEFRKKQIEKILD
jgi:hypothetical protein